MMVVAALSKRIANLDGPTWEKMLHVHKQALIMRWCTKTHEYQMMLRASSCMISSVLCVTTKLEYNSHSVKVFSDILYLLYLSLSIGKHHTEALFSMFNRYIRYRKELDKICLNLIFVCEKISGLVSQESIVDQTHRLSFCIHPAFITSHIKPSLSNKK